MLDQVLRFMAAELDAHLRRRFDLPADAVTAGPLVDAEGRAAVKGRLAVSLVRIEEERLHPQRQRVPKVVEAEGELRTPLQPTLHLNLYVLVAASTQIGYLEGLKMLGAAMAFLQSRVAWTRDEAPGLPDGLDGIVVELHSPDFDESNHLWGLLGARYRPSALYRVRSLPVQDGRLGEPLPPARAVDLEGLR